MKIIAAMRSINSLPYRLELREHVAKTFKKLEKRSGQQLMAVKKKLEEISEGSGRFKPLHPPMHSGYTDIGKGVHLQ